MLQAQPADRRLVEAGQAVEHRGLAGTVGADDGGDLAVPGGEADVIDRDQAAEPHGQVLDREQRANAHSAASRPEPYVPVATHVRVVAHGRRAAPTARGVTAARAAPRS